MRTDPATPEHTEPAPAPDPVRFPGRHLLHTRLATARPRDLLAAAQATGDPAPALLAAQATDTAMRLDATAETLARHLATARHYLDRLDAGGHLCPGYDSTAFTTLGAALDLVIQRQDLLREHLHAQIDAYSQLLRP